LPGAARPPRQRRDQRDRREPKAWRARTRIKETGTETANGIRIEIVTQSRVGRTRLDKIRHGRIRRGTIRLVRTRHDRIRLGMTRLERIKPGVMKPRDALQDNTSFTLMEDRAAFETNQIQRNLRVSVGTFKT
jgi:hypothetical protein